MPKYCEHCGGEMKRGTGGPVPIPMELSNQPTRNVLLHSRCLGAYLRKLEKDKPPLPKAFLPEEMARAGQISLN